MSSPLTTSDAAQASPAAAPPPAAAVSADNSIKKVLTPVIDTSRFHGAGISFKGKLIGMEEVPESRGEKMCHISMAKLKAIVLAIKEHKRPININISVNGLKISDDKSEEVLHAHLVHRISFIFRDTTDARAFGYIYRREDGVHQFFAVKTDKPAEGLVSSLRALFESVYQQKKKEADETKQETATEAVPEESKEVKSEENNEPDFKNPPPPSNDLLSLGDFNSFEQNVFGATSSAPTQSPGNIWLNAYGANGAPAVTAPGGVYPMMSGAYPVQPQHMQMTSQMQQLQLQQVQHQQIQQQQMMYIQQQQSHQQQQQAFAWRQQQPFFPPGQGNISGGSWPPQAVGAAPNVQTHQGQPWLSYDASHGGGPMGVTGAGGSTTTQPASIQVQPLKRDPFADLAFNPSAQTPSTGGSGKKIGKDDFGKEPPKPTLFDVSQSQHQASLDPFGMSESNPFTTTSSDDPFA